VWEEELSRTRARYQQIVKDLADKYPTENLLLVTHGTYLIQFLVHKIDLSVTLKSLLILCNPRLTTLLQNIKEFERTGL
jgi:broad specificity phosphatase PhoE